MKSLKILLLAFTLLLSGAAVNASAQEEDAGASAGLNLQAQSDSQATLDNDGSERLETNVGVNAELRAELEARREAHQERRDDFEERREELRENRAEMRIALEERVVARIENFANGLFRSLDAGVERLRNIAERIGSRIEKIEERDIDLSAQAEALLQAQVMIDEAEAEVAEAHLSLEAMLSSETPREAFGDVRTQLAEAREALRGAKQALLEVVRSIRSELQEQAGSASIELESRTEVEGETE